MPSVLPLDRMTTGEKLQVMEEIWDDLCRTPEEVTSPAWHEAVLRGREERVRAGNAQFSDWSQAKHEIRDAAQ